MTPLPAPVETPFGAWGSPITTQVLTGASVRLSAPALADDGTALWIEGRPAEQGRCVVVAQRLSGTRAEVTPPDLSARSRVHEYGGGAYVVDGDDVFFVDWKSQQLHVASLAAAFAASATQQPTRARALTPAGLAWRFADLIVDRTRGRIIAVGEREREGTEPENVIIAIDLATGALDVLVSGADFYASPRLDAGGRRLAFVSWNHPHMPWDAAGVFIAELDEGGQPGPARHVAGDARASAFGPLFIPDGRLIFAWEPSGFWNLHAWDGVSIQNLCPREAECAQPSWQFGLDVTAIAGPTQLLTGHKAEGRWTVARLDLEDGRLHELDLPVTDLDHVVARNGRALVVGGSPTLPASVIAYDLQTGRHEILKTSIEVPFDLVALASIPEPQTFATTEGDTAHGLFYPPHNPGFSGPPEARPPLVVMAHGGPTAATGAIWTPIIQFWTTRGFAVLDVDYRGSTGYGRAYRQRLAGQWGVFDVDDVVAGARHLAASGRADGRHMAIRGSSAGGFTTLAAATFHDAFTAGASLYGISDLEALARDTHKFESRYTDGLVGPLPEDRAIYRARSPIFHTERLACPLIIFQGLEDRVVPPAQAETMVNALRARKLPVAYLTFEGEQHGFRRAETIRRVFEAELGFYGRLFGFQPHDEIAPVPIENL